jgi:hypothetical protein
MSFAALQAEALHANPHAMSHCLCKDKMSTASTNHTLILNEPVYYILWKSIVLCSIVIIIIINTHIPVPMFHCLIAYQAQGLHVNPHVNSHCCAKAVNLEKSKNSSILNKPVCHIHWNLIVLCDIIIIIISTHIPVPMFHCLIAYHVTMHNLMFLIV